MEKKLHRPTLITTDQTVLCANLLSMPPRLTPTGKISHAKTRVYTQRYRKEWEQMPDFKGWLTSVPTQPTRAYCTYCKKNLHAHRLSLLKHTCTMKHQRAALVHEAEEKKSQKAGASKHDAEQIERMEVETADNSQIEEGEENEEDIEYVVERLDTDEEEEVIATEAIKPNNEGMEEEKMEEKEEENDLCTQLQLSDDDNKSVIKKIKLSEDKCRDTLAEAMARVHGEYFEEESEDQNVELEMVVEEEPANDVRVMSILPDAIDNDNESKESCENGKVTRRSEKKAEKKSIGKVIKQEDNKGNVVVASLPILGSSYQINTSSPTVQNTINVSSLPILPAQSRTITLTSGGKTLTLTGGTFQPGTQYVLSRIKGKLPTLVMADKKPIVAVNQAEPDKNKVPPEIPSTSQQLSKKPVKPVISKKLRISTYVVDTTKGLPASGLQVSLYKLMDGRWTFINESNTNPNGRCIDLLDNAKLNCTSGRYKLHFDVAKYFTLRRFETIYPFIEVALDVKNPHGHYHISIYLSPFGYSTYRSS